MLKISDRKVIVFSLSARVGPHLIVPAQHSRPRGPRDGRRRYTRSQNVTKAIIAASVANPRMTIPTVSMACSVRHQVPLLFPITQIAPISAVF
jgi:hypothetical protein